MLGGKCPRCGGELSLLAGICSSCGWEMDFVNDNETKDVNWPFKFMFEEDLYGQFNPFEQEEENINFISHFFHDPNRPTTFSVNDISSEDFKRRKHGKQSNRNLDDSDWDNDGSIHSSSDG